MVLLDTDVLLAVTQSLHMVVLRYILAHLSCQAGCRIAQQSASVDTCNAECDAANALKCSYHHKTLAIDTCADCQEGCGAGQLPDAHP